LNSPDCKGSFNEQGREVGNAEGNRMLNKQCRGEGNAEGNRLLNKQCRGEGNAQGNRMLKEHTKGRETKVYVRLNNGAEEMGMQSGTEC
jgi:hypothetical protein